MKKVLLIDDAAEVTSVVAATLRCHGFASVVATDGRMGVELATKELPDLIICDVNMPGFDGFDTLKALRQNEATAAMPFIFLSGMAEHPDVRRGMELGADDFLAKPFTPPELIAAIRTRLAKKEEQDRLAEKRLNEVRGNITLALPHELRTPLVGIRGLSSVLIDDHATISPPEILETAQYIHRSAERLQHLVENFLIHAQLQLIEPQDAERLRQDGVAAPTEAQPAVLEAARQMATAVHREADLYCDLVSGFVPVVAEHLRKIVVELVSNAFKFSPPGSLVLVKTRMEDGGFGLIVTDYGRGMTAEQVARIGPHVQFDRQTHEQQGSGLGLAIIRQLVRLYQGECVIQSTPGTETSVSVSFPIPSTPAAPAGK